MHDQKFYKLLRIYILYDPHRGVIDMMVFNVRVSCFPQLSVTQKIDTIWDDRGGGGGQCRHTVP